jgi:Fur family ferric uptake transcriptional regulator
MSDLAVLQERLEGYIQEKGLKSTRQRDVILRVFAGSTDHVSIQELLERVQGDMAGVGYATVYRTMKLFVEAGIAHERHFDDGQTRYEPVAQGHDHHDHLICRDCGHIFEFDDPVIEDRQSAMAAAHGLAIVAHRHDIWGSCLNRATCPRMRREA